MSETRATVRGRVRELLGDVNPAERVVGQFRYDAVMDRQYQIIASRTLRAKEHDIAVTLIAGTYDYTVGTVGETQSVEQVFLDADGVELQYLPLSVLNSRFRQDTTEPADRGTPRHYSTYDNTSQVVKIRVAPTPIDSGALSVVGSSNPVLGTSEGSAILFTEGLIRGLESACAAEIILMLDDAMLARLGLSRGAGVLFREQAEAAIREHNLRQRRLGRGQNHVVRHGSSWLGAWGRG